MLYTWGPVNMVNGGFYKQVVFTSKWKDWPQVGLAQDGSITYTPTPTYTNLFIDQAIELDKPCSSRYETEKLSKRL